MKHGINVPGLDGGVTYLPSSTERIITDAVIAIRLFRRELARHDFSDKERAELLIAAAPALVSIAASQDEEPGDEDIP